MTGRGADIAILALLLALGVATYSPVLGIRPLGGDNLYILAWVDHAPMSSLLRLDPAIYPEWRPLAFQTIWLEHRLLPMSAVAGHFGINLLLWVACSGLVYLLVNELTASRFAAGVAAVLLVVDSRSIETVTWIVERQTSLACGFGLLAVLLVVKARHRALTRRELLSIGLLLVASALSKEYGLAFSGALVSYGLLHRRADLGWTGAAAGFAYVVLRIGLADGALHTYCEDMGYFFDTRTQCIDPFAGRSILQMAYNVIATGFGIPLRGLLDNSGMVGVEPRQLGLSGLLLMVALVGVARGGPLLQLVALVPVFNALLSFMIYRDRNQLIGAAALALATGVGLAHVTRRFPNAPFQHAVRLAVAVVIAAVLSWRGATTNDMVSREVAGLNERDPCDSSVRERSFGDRFAKSVKASYAMDDPSCVGTD